MGITVELPSQITPACTEVGLTQEDLDYVRSLMLIFQFEDVRMLVGYNNGQLNIRTNTVDEARTLAEVFHMGGYKVLHSSSPRALYIANSKWVMPDSYYRRISEYINGLVDFTHYPL